jgi:hypothetical protein
VKDGERNVSGMMGKDEQSDSLPQTVTGQRANNIHSSPF